MAIETRGRHPKLRSDLLIEKQGEGKTLRYLISDPASGRYFRCGAPQYTLIALCTGELSSAEIIARFSAQTRILLRPEQLDAALRQLEELGFLLHADSPGTLDSSVSLAPPHSQRRRRGLGYHRRLFPMQRILPPVQPYISWLFSPGFLGTCFLLTLTTGWIVVHGGWSQGIVPILFGLYFHPSFSTWGLFLVALLVTSYIHECGHALALQHFGRQPGYFGVGFSFPLGILVYVEIGEVWHLAKPGQRIIVSLAGPLASLVVGAVGAIGWWLLPFHPIWSPWFAAFMAFGVLTGVYNLIPVHRTDGYFILADAVQIPNLDHKAWTNLIETLLRPFRRQQPVRKLAVRQHILLAGYGVITLLLDAWLVWVVSGFLIRSVVSLVSFILHVL